MIEWSLSIISDGAFFLNWFGFSHDFDLFYLFLTYLSISFLIFVYYWPKKNFWKSPLKSFVSCNQFLVRPEAKFKHANKHTYVIGYTVSIYCLHTKVRMGKVRSKSPIFCFMTLFCFDADATFAASADDRSKYAHATDCAAAAIVTGDRPVTGHGYGGSQYLKGCNS